MPQVIWRNEGFQISRVGRYIRHFIENEIPFDVIRSLYVPDAPRLEASVQNAQVSR